MSVKETTWSHLISEKGRYASSRNVVVEDEATSWLEDVSTEEILELAMQDYEDASVGLARVEMTTEDDSIEDEWSRTMEKTLSKGINCLWKICHLNQIQEQTLLEQSCRLNLHLKDMQHWMYIFLRMSKGMNTWKWKGPYKYFVKTCNRNLCQ
jgi:hypothetical protein